MSLYSVQCLRPEMEPLASLYLSSFSSSFSYSLFMRAVMTLAMCEGDSVHTSKHLTLLYTVPHTSDDDDIVCLCKYFIKFYVFNQFNSKNTYQSLHQLILLQFGLSSAGQCLLQLYSVRYVPKIWRQIWISSRRAKPNRGSRKSDIVGNSTQWTVFLLLEFTYVHTLY